ncbi:MAG: DUF4199 domain-containing protein [Bacteroidota bacterium]
MKNRTLFLALVYSGIYISAVLYLFFSKRFELFNFIYLLSMGLVLPFVVLVIKFKRDEENGGFIGGRDAVKEGMKFVFFATLILILFQSVFYHLGWKDFKASSIPDFIREKANEANKLGKQKIDESQIQRIINEQIKNITLFKEISFVFFRCIFVGFFSSFVAAFLMKKRRPST